MSFDQLRPRLRSRACSYRWRRRSIDDHYADKRPEFHQKNGSPARPETGRRSAERDSWIFWQSVDLPGAGLRTSTLVSHSPARRILLSGLSVGRSTTKLLCITAGTAAGRVVPRTVSQLVGSSNSAPLDHRRECGGAHCAVLLHASPRLSQGTAHVPGRRANVAVAC